MARFSADGSVLDFATFLGGGSSEYPRGLAIDSAGRVIVGGYTFSSDFPATPGAYDETYNGDQDVFVARLSADGSALDYATFLGGSSRDWHRGLDLDAQGRSHVIGFTTSSDFPTTPGAYDETYNGGQDAFVARLSADGSALDYATFLGGSGNEYPRGVALGAAG